MLKQNTISSSESWCWGYQPILLNRCSLPGRARKLYQRIQVFARCRRRSFTLHAIFTRAREFISRNSQYIQTKDWKEKDYEGWLAQRKRSQKSIWTTLWEGKKKRFPTVGKTKSAFAEKNIRSLKNIQYKNLKDKSFNHYISGLQSFVNTISSHINRVTKLAPNKVNKNTCLNYRRWL